MTQNQKWTDKELAGLKGVDPDSATRKATAEGFPGRSPAAAARNGSRWVATRTSAIRVEDDWLCYAMSASKMWPKIVGTRKSDETPHGTEDSCLCSATSYRQCQNRWQRMGKKGLAIKCSVKPSGRPVLEKMASKTDDNTSLDTTMEAMDLNWNNGAPVPVGSGSVAHSFASMNEIAVRLPAESDMAPDDMAPLATRSPRPTSH